MWGDLDWKYPVTFEWEGARIRVEGYESRLQDNDQKCLTITKSWVTARKKERKGKDAWVATKSLLSTIYNSSPRVLMRWVSWITLFLKLHWHPKTIFEPDRPCTTTSASSMTRPTSTSRCTGPCILALFWSGMFLVRCHSYWRYQILTSGRTRRWRTIDDLDILDRCTTGGRVRLPVWGTSR